MLKEQYLTNRGFSLVEAVIAVGVFGLFATAFVGVSLYFLAPSSAGDRERAAFLADEALEATRSIKDDDWSNLAYNQTGLDSTGSTWAFLGEGTQETVGDYTRYLNFSSVCRNASDEIADCPASYTDSNTKLVQVTVQWQGKSGPQVYYKKEYITNWQAVEAIPPAGVTDLTAGSPTLNSIDLSWTAPGDNGNTGTATTYDIRYSTSIINDGNWSSATPVTGEPSPSVAGTSESITVGSLSSGTTYYFAIKTSDEVPNESVLSNIATETTSAAGDTTPPDAVTDLAAASPAASTIDLSWTAPGDDGATGTATTYDIRYSTATINDGNWASATPVTGESSPSVAGTSESMTVSGLSSNTTYYFAMKTSDEVPNESTLSNVASETTLTADTDLSVDHSGAVIDGGDNTKVIGITFENTGTSDITVTHMQVSWTGAPGGTTIEEITIDGASQWMGSESSGTNLDISDFTLVQGAGSYSINSLDFNNNMTGTTIDILFTMSDGSTKNITGITPGAPADSTPPAAVTDLTASSPTQNSIDLAWTAPGDDGNTGTATTYDIRYSTATINDGNWSSATPVTGEPVPSVAGSSESMTVGSLSSGTTYYFAMKTSDEVPNESTLSNVVSETTTTPDTTPPDAVTDLTASSPTQSSIDLAWTAPGDDGATGTATTYDIRYSTSTITDVNWASATPVTGEPSPSVAGSSESMTVSGLSASTTYYFAMKTSDEVPNESTLSNVASETTTAPGTQADDLSVDYSGVSLSGGGKNVNGMTVENTGASDITITHMTISWTGGASGNNVKSITIGASVVWSGNATTGTLLDITDTVLTSGAGTYGLDPISFKKSMSGATMSIDFTMGDASTKTVSGISL